jgi:hypothetical protein
MTRYTDFITNSYYAEHMGVDCTGATDASSALQSVLNALPNNATLEFPLTATVKLGTTITIADKVGIRLISRVRQQSGSSTPQFLWTASSGNMFDILHCDHPEFVGLGFSNHGLAGNCDTFLNFDGEPAGHIGTLGHVDRCTFTANGVHNTARKGMVSISPTAVNNHENYIIENSSFFGTSTAIVRARDGVTTANSPNVSSAVAAFESGDVGKRIRLSYGGAGVNGGGYVDATILSVTDPQNIALNANMPARTGTQSRVTIHIGQAYGIGVRNGPSQNAIQQQFRNVQFTNLEYGIYMAGGNAQMEHISGGGCDYGIFIATWVAEQCSINWYESENDCRGIECHSSLLLTNSRLSNGNQFGDGFFKFDTGGTITILNCMGSFAPRTNQVLIGTSGAGNALIVSLGNNWNVPLAQVGFRQFGVVPVLSYDMYDSPRIMLLNPPTSDPHVAGQIWSNIGVLTISAG